MIPPCALDGSCFAGAYSHLQDFLGEAAEEWILARGSIMDIPKGRVVLRAGERIETVFFVLKGLFKYYYIGPDGEERIKHFVDEGNFVLSVSSFLERGSSRFFIQALEGSTALAFPAEELRDRARPGGILNRAFEEYLVRSLLEKEEREADFLFMDGKERYESFMKRKPGLAARLRQFEIAAYLGIDPAHLSRIRASR
jgi:CRP-like cAMP-binding protein